MYSVRMRAEREGMHVSGAERLTESIEEVQGVIRELIKRPKSFDKVTITVERIESVEIIPKALTIYSYDFKCVEDAHAFAIERLKEAGIKEEVARLALELLKKGANPKGGNMRGAVLMDWETAERLEPDKERGIRTVRVDWKNRRYIERLLKERGIKKHYIKRLLDALALATKNVYCGVLAELCWSDDPDYTTGYVAGKNIGYVRIKPMKEYGLPLGGRIYFVGKEHLNQLIGCLEKKSVLVESI